MKRSLDINNCVEYTMVQESEPHRPLKAGLNGSVFSRNGSPARRAIWVGNNSPEASPSPLGTQCGYLEGHDTHITSLTGLWKLQKSLFTTLISPLTGLPQGRGYQTLAKRYTHKFLFLVCLTLLLPACLSKKEYSEEEMQALMDAELQRKIAAYRSSKITACQEEAFRQATKIVDSLVIAEAYFDRDTFARPPKPIKPNEKAPEIKGPDTIQLKPLFEGKRKKVKVDTLLKKTKKDTTSRKKN